MSTTSSPFASLLQALLLAKVMSEVKLKQVLASSYTENTSFVDIIADVNALLRNFDLELASVEDHWTGDCHYGIV